jgi:hypothetical protein
MANEKSQKIRLIVAFGDISGFSNFCDAITNDEVEYDPLMSRFDKIIDDAEQKTGYAFRDTGDGFMCTVNLPSGHACRITADVIMALWGILQKVDAVFAEHRRDSICPEGFRIVVAAGYVKQIIKKDGRIILRGKSLNLAHNFLDEARGLGIVAHDSVRNLISQPQAKKYGIEFSRIKRNPMLSIVKVRADRRTR